MTHDEDRDNYCPECDAYLGTCDICGQTVHAGGWGPATDEGDDVCLGCWQAASALRQATGMGPRAYERARQYARWVVT